MAGLAGRYRNMSCPPEPGTCTRYGVRGTTLCDTSPSNRHAYKDERVATYTVRVRKCTLIMLPPIPGNLVCNIDLISADQHTVPSDGGLWIRLDPALNGCITVATMTKSQNHSTTGSNWTSRRINTRSTWIDVGS